MKRFYKVAAATPVDDGWTVTLDGRPIRTPGKVAFIAPLADVAAAAAAEWDAQEGEVDPGSMPVTRAVNTAIDKTGREFDAVAEAVAAYGGSDLVCYRAEEPAGLRARQDASWDPVIDWLAARFGASLSVASGLMHVAQPEEGQARLLQAVRAHSPLGLTALYDLVALSGSLALGLAVAERRLAPDEAWAASRIDEAWQEEFWGVDDEAARVAALKQAEFAAAARLMAMIRAG